VGEASPERVASVTHIAALPFLSGLAGNDRAQKDFLQLIDDIGDDVARRLDVLEAKHPLTLHYDASILFPGRLEDVLEETLVGDELSRRKRVAAGALQRFLSKRGEPSPYFAVLLADGDRMGKVIDKIGKLSEHRQLSVALASFAGDARRIVADHAGQTIYAGGDDVLAFVPLHTLVACADTLAQAFHSALVSFQDDGGQSPTLSMGIVIAHALTPLDDSLEEARRAEKEAKAVPGKDAACIRVVKRGGEPVSVSGNREAVTELLRELQGWHADGALSSKAQYELMSLARLAKDRPGGADGRRVDEMIAAQTARVLGRRRERGGAEASAAVLERAARIAGEQTPEALGRALYIAQLLERAQRLAQPRDSVEQGKDTDQ
jgi:CRISPR-associated protein Cmr2